jgi:hypothetical protein
MAAQEKPSCGKCGKSISTVRYAYGPRIQAEGSIRAGLEGRHVSLSKLRSHGGGTHLPSTAAEAQADLTEVARASAERKPAWSFDHSKPPLARYSPDLRSKNSRSTISRPTCSYSSASLRSLSSSVRPRCRRRP